MFPSLFSAAIRVDVSDVNPDNWCMEIYFDSLVAWHFPYEDCWPRHPGDVNDPFSTCTPMATCYHDDCCVGGADGASVD